MLPTLLLSELHRKLPWVDSNGLVSLTPQSMLGKSIYLTSSDMLTFNSGTSNVKLIINYGIYTYP